MTTGEPLTIPAGETTSETTGVPLARELVKYIRYYNNDWIKLRLNGKSSVHYRALFQSKEAS